MSGFQRMISINFAGTDYKRLARIRTAILGFVLLLLAGACLLGWQYRASRREQTDLELKLQDVAASEAKLRPAIQEREQLSANLQAMTALVESRRLSWTDLLSSIERAFPSGLSLSKLDFNPKDYSVVLEGVAQSPEALSRLMIELQRSQTFKNPQLKRQSIDKGILSFNVMATYQEPPVSGRHPESARRSGK